MSGQKIQSDQLVIDTKHRSIDNYPRQEYNQIVELVDDKLTYPSKIILNTVSGVDAVTKIFSSPIERKQGTDQDSVSGIGVLEALPPVGGSFFEYPESYIDWNTGGTTGAIAFDSTPTTTDGSWRWALIYADGTSGNYGVVFGDESVSKPDYGASMPDSPNDTQPLCSLRLNNSGGGSFNFLRPDETDIFNHSRGGGGGATAATIKLDPLQNNTSGQDIDGLIFDKTQTKGAVVFFDVHRETDSQNVQETGAWAVTYDPADDEWRIKIMISSFDFTGVTPNITSSGQVQVATDNLTGANYDGALRVINIGSFDQ